MNKTNTETDFLAVGKNLLKWYARASRELPWRETRDPYKIWICEIVLQQTRVEQGKNHYIRFIERFPDVFALADAATDEVLLYWKGLGYYSRALNLHAAAQQIVSTYGGRFPSTFDEILTLKGVGKYTAAAIASICFDEKIPAVDGNFYRVLSRVFADGFDVSAAQAHAYFSRLALRVMPEEDPGHFNQAVMDLGSEICRPKNPRCSECPIQQHCLAYAAGTVSQFPVKTKKVKVDELQLSYFLVQHAGQFLIRQRDDSSIWKKLYDFPQHIPTAWQPFVVKETLMQHKLTHKNLALRFHHLKLEEEAAFLEFAAAQGFIVVNYEGSLQKSFPKPLENYLRKLFEP